MQSGQVWEMQKRPAGMWSQAVQVVVVVVMHVSYQTQRAPTP